MNIKVRNNYHMEREREQQEREYKQRLIDSNISPAGEKTCYNCKSVLEYFKRDITRENTGFYCNEYESKSAMIGKSYDPSLLVFYQHYWEYIVCPVCNNKIKVSDGNIKCNKYGESI